MKAEFICYKTLFQRVYMYFVCNGNNYLCIFHHSFIIISYIFSCGISMFNIVEGLLLAWNRGFRKVILESDSQNLISNLNLADKKKRENVVLSLFLRCIEILNRDWQVLLCHTLRKENKVADWLANYGI